MSSTIGPPILARLLLTAVLRGEARAHQIGDLDEEYYDRQLPEVGARAARRWYWRQVFGSLRPALAGRLPDPGSSLFRGGGARSGVVEDLLYGTRTLRRAPGFTIVAVAILALGIATNTLVFTLVNAVLLRPLPYPDQDRLVQLSETLANIEDIDISLPDFVDWERQAESFEAMGAFDDTRFIVGTNEPERIEGAVVTAGLLPALGVAPQIGRVFRRDEDRPGADRVAIFSHRLWQGRFSGDQDLVGDTVTIDGEARTVVGIMPPGFNFPEIADIWVPLALDPATASRDDYQYDAVARLKPEATIVATRAEAQRITTGIAERFPESKSGLGAEVYPLRDADVGSELRLTLWALFGSVSFVLLIACANVANLVMIRTTGRQSELAIRSALGAGRWRIVRQLMIEGLLIATSATAGGFLLGSWGGDLVEAAIPTELPTWIRLDLDLRVFGYVALTGALVAVVFGLAPALRATGCRAGSSLRATAVSLTPRGSMLRWLVVVQVALAVVLLSGAGLMIRSFLALRSVDPGLNPDGVLTVRFNVPFFSHPELEPRDLVFRQVVENVGALPGVSSVGGVGALPLSNSDDETYFRTEAQSGAPRSELPVALFNVATPGYVEAMQIPVLAGRTFRWSDGEEGGLPVAIVNETLARIHWPDRSAVGQRLRLEHPAIELPWMTVIGVVGDVMNTGLDQGHRAEIYFPFPRIRLLSMTLGVRTTGDPVEIVDSVRARVWEVDPGLPVYEIHTLEDVVRRSLWQQRLFSWLFSLFGIFAVLLAAVGIYGVVAHATSVRSREIGLRIALGAGRRDVLDVVLRQGVGAALIGIAAGMALALATTRVLAGLLYELEPTDPLTLAATLLLFLTAVGTACLLPARRAMTVDPTVALRGE